MKAGRALMGLLLTAGCARGAHAEEPAWRRVVLVELFTSQGCSSCPAADRLVRELPALGLGRDKVLPLTFHVDYWDNLGWKDAFAAPAYTGRQRWYAASGRLRPPDGDEALTGLYTPQLVVGGTVHLSGQRRALALETIRRSAEAAPAIRSRRRRPPPPATRSRSACARRPARGSRFATTGGSWWRWPREPPARPCAPERTAARRSRRRRSCARSPIACRSGSPAPRP